MKTKSLHELTQGTIIHLKSVLRKLWALEQQGKATTREHLRRLRLEAQLGVKAADLDPYKSYKVAKEWYNDHTEEERRNA